MTNNNKQKRTPDEDMKDAFDQNCTPEFELDDIKDILAGIAGGNDEYNWYWVVELNDDRFALIDAWCGYTGWDVTSGVTIELGSTPDEVIEKAPDEEMYSHRRIKTQLKNQLLGTQPFGLYDDSVE